MILYANSDSYGVASTGKTYVDFIGKKLNTNQVVNNGLSGSCNRRIIRTSIRDLLSLKKQDKNIVGIIGLAPINRFEYWGETVTGNDGHFKSLQPAGIVPKEAKKLHQGHVETYNYEASNTNLFVDIILLTSFFKTNNIKYLIWQGSQTLKPSDFAAPFINSFYDQVQLDSNVLDMFDFSFSKYCSTIKGYTPYDNHLYGIYGHHAEPAHQDFAEYLLENYLNEI